MIRRTVEAIRAAHLMDPARRELYVEGHKDELFLVWLAGNELDENTVIHPIDMVDIPHAGQGGNRARVLLFAAAVERDQLAIRCLVDADDHRCGDPIKVPSNTWITDLRDLEWYVLNVELLEKVLLLGIGNADISAATLLDKAIEIGRFLAALRAAAESPDWKLSTSGLPLKKFVKPQSGGQIEFDSSKTLRSAMQVANVSLSKQSDLAKAVRVQLEAMAECPAHDVVRGKDVLGVLAEVFLKVCGIGRDHGHRLMWTSFERSQVEHHPALSEVLAFLIAA